MDSLDSFQNTLSNQSTDVAAYIGIDWADRKHDICLHDLATNTQEFCVIEHRPEAIDTWVEGLQKRYDGHRIAICTEQKRDSLIYALWAPRKIDLAIAETAEISLMTLNKRLLFSIKLN